MVASRLQPVEVALTAKPRTARPAAKPENTKKLGKGLALFYVLALITTKSQGREDKIIDGQVALFASHDDFMRYLDTFDSALHCIYG